ncbi:MAG TPA: GNAT family N-acetyltransferase [Blastocatellia bacterium]|nr:GNAT family N-acetyltransferase [Blastocatellia bacterium]
MDFKIRPATADDAECLARLRYEFRVGFSETTESEPEFLERCEQWMANRLSDKSQWRCWVAEYEGQFIGNAWLQLIEKIPNPAVEPELHGYLTNFFVREKMRNRGVGSKLLKIALDYCNASGVHAVFLWPTDESRTLYISHGIGPTTLIFAKHLSPAEQTKGKCDE